ncbi:Glycosyl transferases group 1 [Anaerocolumna jejuensis DSM 15929]|uniref:Glycosyl transferases group 1 n=1 Tax=Anaerocolumna jejuensis DSM 15929 TaxID=1121322 RepID=A0A1M6PYG5_9FIRM|nr:glycosyltransferase family 4 protein [Anaerocolumna jejuensis]SHK13004.1 Glycosyl transferases group 1 [Anaerocolumna jejuensis DSM 15929]
MKGKHFRTLFMAVPQAGLRYAMGASMKKAKMKLLLIQSMGYLYPWAGANKANKLLMEWMAERGHQCRVINPLLSPPGFNENEYIREKSGENELELLESTDSMTHIRINGVEAYTVTSEFNIISFIRKTIEEFQPDITLVSDTQPYILLETVTELKTKAVFLAHSQSTLPFGPDSFEEDRDKLRLFKKLQGIISVSKFLDNYFRKWADVESKVIYFPSYGKGPFPYLGNFHNSFVTVINPSALKGFCIFRELARRMPNVQFAAVPTWATAEEELEEMKAAPNITLLKPSEDINDIYRKTRIFLMPSLWGESFGQVVIEAMLRGIPVIASNVGGLPEAKLGLDYILPVEPIRQYSTDNSLMGSVAQPVVPEQDLEPWVHALEKLINNREHYDFLSRASYKKAQAFQASLGFELFEHYFQEICENTDIYRESITKPERNSILGRVDTLSPAKRDQLVSLLQERRR